MGDFTHFFCNSTDTRALKLLFQFPVPTMYRSPSKVRSKTCMPVWLIALIAVLAVAGVTVLIIYLCGGFTSKSTEQTQTEGEQSQQAIQYGPQQHDRPIDRANSLTGHDQVPPCTQIVGTRSTPGALPHIAGKLSA